jgi:hypothetical protein
MIGFLLFILTGAGGGWAWYVWTGRVRRTRPCRHCGGWGFTSRRGLLSTSPAQCGKCGGSGQVLRPAARRARRRKLRAVQRAPRAVRAGQRVVRSR